MIFLTTEINFFSFAVETYTLLNYGLHDKTYKDVLEMHPRGDLDLTIYWFSWVGVARVLSSLVQENKRVWCFFQAHGATAGWTPTCSASARKLDTS